MLSWAMYMYCSRAQSNSTQQYLGTLYWTPPTLPPSSSLYTDWGYRTWSQPLSKEISAPIHVRQAKSRAFSNGVFEVAHTQHADDFHEASVSNSRCKKLRWPPWCKWARRKTARWHTWPRPRPQWSSSALGCSDGSTYKRDIIMEQNSGTHTHRD